MADAFPLSGYQLGAVLAGASAGAVEPAVTVTVTVPASAAGADPDRWRAASRAVLDRYPALGATVDLVTAPVPLQVTGAGQDGARVTVEAGDAGVVVEFRTSAPVLDHAAGLVLASELTGRRTAAASAVAGTRDLLARAGTGAAQLGELSVPAGDPDAVHLATAMLPAETVAGLRESAGRYPASLTDLLLTAHLWVVGRFAGEARAVGWWLADARSELGVPAEAMGEFRIAVPVGIDRRAARWRNLVEAVTGQTDLTGRLAELVPAVPAGRGSTFEYRATPPDQFLDSGVRVTYSDRPVARFALTVTALPGGRLEVDVTHPDGDARQILRAFQEALAALATDPDGHPAGSGRPVHTGGLAAPAALAHATVFRWAEQGDPVAVCDGDKPPLRYSELRAAAWTVAAALRGAGVRPEEPVGVFGHRSSEMVVALLGVLAAGAVAVPLDAEYPAARSARALVDAGVTLLLTVDDSPVPPGFSGRVLPISLAASTDPGPPVGHAVAGRLAYCLYTSGSTGRPKGVDVTHGGLVNLIRWTADRLAFGPGDRVAQRTPVAFDAGLGEIFMALGCGATLVVLPPAATREPAVLERELRAGRITVLQMVPGLVTEHLAARVFERCPDLRLLLCGGEALSRSVVDAFAAQSSAGVVNLYGPTECTVDASWWAARPGADPDAVPIGLPVAGVSGYVLDELGQPVPPYVPGELHLTGAQLARGYRGQPGATAERFVPDPYADRPGARAYRTGDQVRVLDDGSWQYLGRQDGQVKILGTRVEAGEVERAVSTLPGVRAAAVTVRRPAGLPPVLVAHVVADHPLDTGRLRDLLRERLPAAALPAVWHPVAALPQLPSGKTDRGRLARADHTPAVPYRPPFGRAQREVAWLCAAMLGVDAVGRDDDLVELGLDPVRRMRLLAALAGGRAAAGSGRTIPEIVATLPTTEESD